jgi:hypothetical protein
LSAIQLSNVNPEDEPNLTFHSKTFQSIRHSFFVDAGVESYYLVDGIIPTAASYLKLAKWLEVPASLN